MPFRIVVLHEQNWEKSIEKRCINMKKSDAYRKTISFITAAMAFAATVASCSSPDESSSRSDSSVTSEATSSADSSQTTAESSPALSADQLSNLSKDYSSLFSDRDHDPSYDTVSAEIKLSGDSVEISGKGAAAEGTVITISEDGTYRITGTLNDGQLIVNAPKAKVQLVLDNADITCKTSAPVNILDCDKTFITLAENSKNSVTDSRSACTDENSEAPDSAIFSEDSLTINGSGSLTVKGGYLDGVHSKDDIVITGGKLDITAVNNGIKGKDYVAAANGEITVNAQNDGVKSTNTDDSSLGFVYVEDGSFNITAGGDGIQAETVFYACGGTFNIMSGGGSEKAPENNGNGSGGGFGGGRGEIRFPTDENGKIQMPDMPDIDVQFPTDENGKIQIPDMPDIDVQFPTDENGKIQMPDMPDIDVQFPTDENGKIQMPDFPNGGNFGHGGIEIPTDENGNFTKPQRPDGFGGGRFPQNGEASDDSDSADTVSVKGIKAGLAVSISGGKFNVDAYDDTLHSNGNMFISGGNITLKAGSKGVHADGQIAVSGSADINIAESYEGIEAAVINISDGNVRIKASDDGFNGSDGSNQGGMGNYSQSVQLNISGGTVYVDAEGDGLDSNGNINISGGTVIVNGPQNGGNGALDVNGKMTVNGGLLIAAGSSGMAESPDSSSTQNCISANLGKTFNGGTLVTLTNSKGEEILSFAPSKTFGHIVISSPDIKTDAEYTLSTGGSSSAEAADGLYKVGGYKNDGTSVGSVTVKESVSFIGQQGGFGGGGFGGGKRPRSNDETI